MTLRSGTVSIRKAVESDAAACLTFAQTIFHLTDQLLRVPNELQLTVEQEAQWIRDAREKNNLILIACDGNRVIGLLNCEVKPFVKQRHVGEFGVSVHPEFQNNGVGSRMITEMLEWVRTETVIEKLVLNVFHTNRRAIALYKRFGFEDECRQRKAAKQPNGSYVDLIQMSLFVHDFANA